MPPVVAPSEIRRYLLGGLEEPRAASLESQYFADPATFDEVWDVEHNLVDEYASGALAGAEREQFERHYLASDVHRARLAAARALLELTTREPALPEPAPSETTLREQAGATPVGGARVLAGPWHRRPAVRWAAAAALLVLLLGTAWIVSRPAPVTVQQAQRGGVAPAVPQPAPPPTVPGPAPGAAGETPVPKPPPPAPVLFAVTLSPVLTRASEQRSVAIPADATHVVLRLEGTREGEQDRVQVEVRTVDGRAVWTGPATPAARASGLIARVRIPAVRLPPDDYLVTAFALEDATKVPTELARYTLRTARP